MITQRKVSPLSYTQAKRRFSGREGIRRGLERAKHVSLLIAVDNYVKNASCDFKAEWRIKMIIYPAIDLYEGQAVRLVKGDYNQKTVYSENPAEVALDFKACGAERIHTVDLEGAKTGETPNIDIVMKIKEASGLFVEIGGGIRDLKTIRRYLDSGINRVILGTAAVENPELAAEAVSLYHERIALGIDLKDGFVAIKGWLENSSLKAEEFLSKMCEIGVRAVICTDISKDGMMQGPNRLLYQQLSKEFPDIDLIASGGVSSIEDIKNLKSLGLHGAIVGKAYYTGAVDLKEAIAIAE